MKNLTQPIIRSLRQEDIKVLADLYFPWTSHKETFEKWSRNLKEQDEGIRLSCIVEYQNKIAGYGNLLRYSEYPLFRDKKIPEINDVWIYDQYRKKGFGTCLINHFEKLAQGEHYTQIGIGVGLYQDYGAAQKLYFELGYKPDGRGVTYKGKTGIPGESYPLDDDLILWLVKSLPREQ
ncbi:MAG: GNAT family N-acetyltransferase [Parachlamydiaceae bacterium]|nr:GNAT family N-acetyltransferase [Parachlamydiaceae bacterium]